MSKKIATSVSDELEALVDGEAKRRGCSKSDILRELVITHCRSTKHVPTHVREDRPPMAGPGSVSTDRNPGADRD